MSRMFLVVFIISSILQIAEGSLNTQNSIVIVDEMEREVKVPYPPERIVALGGAAAQIIHVLGYGEKIVGRSDWVCFLPYLKEKPSIGSCAQPSMEILWNLKPDVVVADTHFWGSTSKIEALGIPMVFISGYELATVEPGIRKLGKIFKKEERADEYIGFIRNHTNLIKKRVDGLKQEEKPTVFYGYGYEGYRTSSDKSKKEVLQVTAGGINIAADLTIPWPVVSAEWLVEKDPDFFFLGANLKKIGYQVAGLELMRSLWKDLIRRPGIRKLSCVRKGQIYIVDSRIGYGPRAVIGALYLAKLFHPELFEDIDPVSVHREMLKRFYGIELEGVYIYP